MSSASARISGHDTTDCDVLTETPNERMSNAPINIIPVSGMPEVVAGSDLGSTLAAIIRQSDLDLRDQDVLVIAQKVVSKSEDRIVPLDHVQPSVGAFEWAREFGKDPRVVEVVLRESKRIVRMERGIIISETHHGFVCANAGVDTSNVPDNCVAILPEDPDASAARLRDTLEREFDCRLAVIVSDTFGRPWREGLVNVAIGISGIEPLIDYRGQLDSHGHPLRVTVIAVADELASAAELVMRKSDGVPAVIVRGFPFEPANSRARRLIRDESLDLFR
jgi:coenzyme F420-0:L-glutamate ligase/coenzyme F420-1:gamma-L-glutamate ligase